MKGIKIIPLILAVIMVLSACKSASGTSAIDKTGFGADITHDGTNDSIRGYFDGIENGNANVKITTKDSKGNKVVLWKDTLGTNKNGYKGIYVCRKSGDMNILIWQPTVADGKTTLEYDIFYINYDESSKHMSVRSLEGDKITYSAAEVKKDGAKYKDATAFVKKLNKYLSKSMAIIDTVDGKLVYTAKSSDRKYKLYHPDWYDTSNDEVTSKAESKATTSGTVSIYSAPSTGEPTSSTIM